MESTPAPDKMVEAEIDREIANNPKNIPGWGIDADDENDPTYPMKQWNGADHQRFNYEKPTQQPIHESVFHSIERPGVSRVFGTSTPPRGLSGMIRRYAYKHHSESTYSHWVPLVIADRINVIEGYIDDIFHGIVPNPFEGRGWQAEWKYNRKGAIKSIAVTAAVTAALVTTFMLIKNKKAKQNLG